MTYFLGPVTSNVYHESGVLHWPIISLQQSKTNRSRQCSLNCSGRQSHH